MFQIVTRGICNLVSKLHNRMENCVTVDKLCCPMCRCVLFYATPQIGRHNLSSCYTQFQIGLCYLSTRLQISRVTIYKTGLHSYRRGPAWSVKYGRDFFQLFTTCLLLVKLFLFKKSLSKFQTLVFLLLSVI